MEVSHPVQFQYQLLCQVINFGELYRQQPVIVLKGVNKAAADDRNR